MAVSLKRTAEVELIPVAKKSGQLQENATTAPTAS
jgi:hypothetical protein